MKYIKPLLILLAIALSAGSAPAQLADHQPFDSQLWLDAEGSAFFRDNEFDSPLMKGYSLPGFRISPALRYEASPWVSLSVGFYALKYWGAEKYPDTAYLGIPSYATDASKGAHILPFLRLEMRTRDGWRFVLGDIHRNDCHQMLRQIYNPELALTSDPEAGAQVLYSNQWLDLDLWLDWHTFIYNDSPYQENFFVGLSSQLKYNSIESAAHLYTPIQALIEHRGGEIDTILMNGVQTFINASAGLGARFRLHGRYARSLAVEANILCSYQQAGHTWPDTKGLAAYVCGKLDAGKCMIELGYFKAWKYNTILGYPLWGVSSYHTDGLVLRQPSTIYAGLNYSHQFAPGFTLGAKVDFYQGIPCDACDRATGDRLHYGAKTSFAFEVTGSFSPSFLLKRFRPARPQPLSQIR